MTRMHCPLSARALDLVSNIGATRKAFLWISTGSITFEQVFKVMIDCFFSSFHGWNMTIAKCWFNIHFRTKEVSRLLIWQEDKRTSLNLTIFTLLCIYAIEDLQQAAMLENLTRVCRYTVSQSPLSFAFITLVKMATLWKAKTSWCCNNW